MIKFESTDHYTEGFVTTEDNIKIFFKKLKPENPIKNVIIVPGFGANANQFLGMQHFFYEKGYCSIVLELRGHGFSEGKPGFVENYSDYCKDIDQVINEVTEKNIETIICGHSNGGLASTYYTLKNPGKISSIVLFSPWFGLTLPLRWYEILLKTVALLVYPSLSAPMGERGAVASGCTTNPVWLRILDVDKQIYKWASAKANEEVEIAQTFCYGNVPSLTQPFLLIHGDKDPVTSYQNSKDIFDLVGSNKKKMITLSKNVHHLFLEKENVKELYDAILNFIEK